MLFRQLDETETELDEVRSRSGGDDRKLQTLESRVEGQAELIETLRHEAAEANILQAEVRAKDLEIERLRSEIESKQDLVHALRRDAGSLETLKAEKEEQDEELAKQRADLELAERRLDDLRAEYQALNENSISDAADEHAELVAVRAELEARKALVKSLRADAERVTMLEEQLEAKRETVAALEESINRHVETSAELKRSGETWKRKYQELRGVGATSNELPVLAADDVHLMQRLELDEKTTDRTLAIDMSRPLSEARRSTTKR